MCCIINGAPLHSKMNKYSQKNQNKERTDHFQQRHSKGRDTLLKTLDC